MSEEITELNKIRISLNKEKFQFEGEHKKIINNYNATIKDLKNMNEVNKNKLSTLINKMNNSKVNDESTTNSQQQIIKELANELKNLKIEKKTIIKDSESKINEFKIKNQNLVEEKLKLEESLAEQKINIEKFTSPLSIEVNQY